MKPTTGLDENSTQSLPYSLLRSGSSKDQVSIAITQVDPKMITVNDNHVQKEYTPIQLNNFPEFIYMRSQIEQLDSQLSSTSDQITSMVDMFNREKDKLQLKITSTRKKIR